MHETSPGQVEKHELSIRSDNKSEFDGANIDMNVKFESFESEGDDESTQRIYDDPCELMDDVPIFRMPRSRSWFCCPSTENTVPNSIFYNRCPDYSLVTEAPKIQLHTVGRPIARKHQTNSIFFRLYFLSSSSSSAALSSS